MTRSLIIGSVVGIFAVTLVLWGVTQFWQGLGNGLSGHGWIAYFAGGIFTLALSAGLFSLTFFSARSGHDDDAARHDPFQDR